MMDHNPRLMRRFFFAVAANLCKAVQETAKSMTHLKNADPNAEKEAAHAHNDSESAFELALRFGIEVEDEEDAERQLLAVRECRVSFEAGSLKV
jgi:hypothetical protein